MVRIDANALKSEVGQVNSKKVSKSTDVKRSRQSIYGGSVANPVWLRIELSEPHGRDTELENQRSW